MRPYIRLTFEDNGQKEAQLRVYPADTSEAGAGAYALALAAAIEAVSDAAIVKLELVWPMPGVGSQVPGPASDVRAYTLLFYREGSRVASIGVPSANALPYDDTGPYAGIRVTRNRAEVSGVLPQLQAIPALLVGPDGTSFPQLFSVGGRVDI